MTARRLRIIDVFLGAVSTFYINLGSWRSRDGEKAENCSC